MALYDASVPCLVEVQQGVVDLWSLGPMVSQRKTFVRVNRGYETCLRRWMFSAYRDKSGLRGPRATLHLGVQVNNFIRSLFAKGGVPQLDWILLWSSALPPTTWWKRVSKQAMLEHRPWAASRQLARTWQ